MVDLKFYQCPFKVQKGFARCFQVLLPSWATLCFAVLFEYLLVLKAKMYIFGFNYIKFWSFFPFGLAKTKTYTTARCKVKKQVQVELQLDSLYFAHKNNVLTR